MQELSELVRILSARRSRTIKLFIEEEEAPDSFYLRLYEGIRSGEYTTDEGAAAALYDAEPGDNRYQILKSRLKSRLYPLLFFLDIRQPAHSAVQEAEYRSLLDMVEATILLRTGGRQLGIKIIQKLLVTAQRYGLTRMEVESLKMLRSHYAVSGLMPHYERYNNLLQQALELLDREYKAEELLDNLTIHFVHSTAHKPDLYGVAGSMIDDIEALRSRGSTRTIEELYYRIKAYAHQVRLEYDKALEVCSQAQLYFKENPLFASAPLMGGIALIHAECCLHLGRYDEGKQFAQACLSYLPLYSNNWMLAHTPYFLLAMHSEDFALADQVLSTITQQPRFVHNQNPARIALWKIFEGYLMYCFHSGWAQFSTAELPQGTPRFRLSRLLNEVQSISRDKSGTNCSVLVLQVLWLLEERKYEEIDRMSDALTNYAKRYLRSDSCRRSLLFIRMVLAMCRSGFERKGTQKRAAKYTNELRSLHPLFFKGMSSAERRLDSLEVLPYEKLWEHMLARLQ